MTHFNEAEFKQFESKIDDVLKLLQDMTINDSPDTNIESNISNNSTSVTPNEEEFIVKIRDNRTVINDAPSQQATPNEPHTVNKFTFMQQLEQDAAARAENRKNREIIADNFRRLGNQAFKEKKFEEAVNSYTKAIDHIKDSPIVYNNRALSFIKLNLYKRALIDCDFVIHRLDEKNLRSWLYRAVAYYNLDDEVNFEKSIKMAKKNNPSEVIYIEKFAKTIKDI